MYVPLYLLDRGTGELHRTLTLPADPGGGAAIVVFSPDDAFLAGSHQIDLVRLFRAADGAVLRDVHMPAVYEAVSFSPDSRRLMVGSVFGHTMLAGLPSGKMVRIDTIDNPFAAAIPLGVTWSPWDDRFFVTRDGIELRSGRTGARLAEIPGGFELHEALVRFEAGGRSGLLAACNGLVERIVLVPFSIDVLRSPSVEIQCLLTASEDGTRLFRATSEGLDIFDVPSRSSREVLASGDPQSAPYVSPDGRWYAQVRIVAGGVPMDNKVVVFDVEQATTAAVLSGDVVVGWSATGELYRAAGGDVVAWSPSSGSDVFRASFEDTPDALQMSPDGRFVAAPDGQLVLIRTLDHAVLRVAADTASGAPRIVPEAEEIAAFLR